MYFMCWKTRLMIAFLQLKEKKMNLFIGLFAHEKKVVRELLH